MPLRINFNVESSAAQRGLTSAQGSYFKSVEALSSGLRINRASDDSAGLAVSEKLKNQVRGINQAQRNAQDAISLLTVAEGALNQTHSLLARMRELAVQSASDTLTSTDRTQISQEFSQLQTEIDRISSVTQFNSQNLLDGTFTTRQIHIGANTTQEITICVTNASTSCFGVDNGTVGVTTQTCANATISIIDGAVSAVTAMRSYFGALTNRLNSTSTYLGVASENQAAANSRIRDTDVASASAELVRSQIMQQAAQAVLAQANQAPQSALSLLR